MFDSAFLQMIEHLITGDHSLASNSERLLEIRHIEIADAIDVIAPSFRSPTFAGSWPREMLSETL